MKRDQIRKKSITNLHQLKQFKKVLRASYQDDLSDIASDWKRLIASLPNRLLSGSLQSEKADLQDKGLERYIGRSTARLTRAILPGSMALLYRWLTGLVVSKMVSKTVFAHGHSQNNATSPKSIDMNPNRTVPKADARPAGGHPRKQAEQVRVKKQKISLKGIWEVLKDSFSGFTDHKVTKMSGSLAYYTVFSMAPLMVMVIALCGIFLEKDAAQGQIYLQLKGFVGAETAAQLQELIAKASIGDKGVMASIIGGVTLLIGATSIFADIQDSINSIWGIKPKPKRGWLKMLQNRFLSFSVIVSLGFVLLVSLAVSAVLDGFSSRLKLRFEDVSVIIFNVLNILVTFGVITVIFGVIFKVLPDAKIRWKDVAWGAMVTAVLFMLGKLGISFYIGQSDVGGTYGAAGSQVVVLLWAYYSSIILYFGAEFTKAYAVRFGEEIHPNSYAVTIKEVEQGSASVQQTEQSG